MPLSGCGHMYGCSGIGMIVASGGGASSAARRAASISSYTSRGDFSGSAANGDRGAVLGVSSP